MNTQIRSFVVVAFFVASGCVPDGRKYNLLDTLLEKDVLEKDQKLIDEELRRADSLIKSKKHVDSLLQLDSNQYDDLHIGETLPRKNKYVDTIRIK